MTASLLPAAFPKIIAAAIKRCDIKTFVARVVEPGLVLLDDRGRVTRQSLEAHLGHPISPERYVAALQKRDHAKAYQQTYRDTRREQAHVA